MPLNTELVMRHRAGALRTAYPTSESEDLAEVAGRSVCGEAVGVGVRGEGRPELDLGDVVDTGPPKPVEQIGRLEVRTERRRPAATVHRARVDQRRLLVRQQAGVPGDRIEVEHQPG